MLTQKQLDRLKKYDNATLLQIMHECAEITGCVSVGEYNEFTGIPKRTIYDKMRDGKIEFFKNSGKFMPLLNERKI